jgi:hypothetical protein
MQEVQTALTAAAEVCGLRLKPLDKKAERASLLQIRQEALQSQLMQATDPAAVLGLVVPLLIAQV